MEREAGDGGERPIELRLRDGLQGHDERERVLLRPRRLEHRVDVDRLVGEGARDLREDSGAVPHDEADVEGGDELGGTRLPERGEGGEAEGWNERLPPPPPEGDDRGQDGP